MANPNLFRLWWRNGDFLIQTEIGKDNFINKLSEYKKSSSFEDDPDMFCEWLSGQGYYAEALNIDASIYFNLKE